MGWGVRGGEGAGSSSARACLMTMTHCGQLALSATQSRVLDQTKCQNTVLPLQAAQQPAQVCTFCCTQTCKVRLVLMPEQKQRAGAREPSALLAEHAMSSKGKSRASIMPWIVVIPSEPPISARRIFIRLFLSGCFYPAIHAHYL